MEGQSALVFLSLLYVATSTVVDPRGARPIEHGYKADKCATQKEWPFCTDIDWGSKCPSGCRVQGLMDTYDHDLLKKIKLIRDLLTANQGKYRSADLVSKQTYDRLKDKLTVDAGHDTTYYGLAKNLRQRIVDLKIKIDKQLRVMASMKDQVKEQIIDMQRLEVDIDIKLRACKGSCKTTGEYSVDHEDYVALNKQVQQLDSQSAQSIDTVKTIYVMKSRLLKDVEVDTRYKSKDVDGGAGGQREDFFPEVKTIQLILEEEGSSASAPATISKDPGSSSSTFSASTSSTSVKDGPAKSITELGRGDGDIFGGLTGGFEAFNQPSITHVSSQSVSCQKRTRTITTHTKDGPVETTEEVMEGGPECQGMTDLTKGSLGTFFPSLSHSSSSVSSTKTVYSASAKGSLLHDTKSLPLFNTDAGLDLGAFLTDAADDDTPDFHARSVKSTRVERQADYVGKDCADIQQKHLNGETNGLFKVKPGGLDSKEVVEVYCQQEGLMGGWLLVQRRESGALNFNRTWAEYRGGFGSVDAQGKGEMWLGNQNLHLLTSQGEIMLRVQLEDWEGGVATAEYTIRVGSEAEGYQLHVSGYTGDAGDALVRGESSLGSFLSHQGMKFSTFDKDNDKWEESCAEMYGGGWWYNNCQSANLNGIYYKGQYDPGSNTPYEIENGVVWVTYKPADYSLKTVKMFIRPAAFLCKKLKQQNQDGHHPLGQTDRDRRKRCPAVSEYSLCSDDDWVSKCPSGCRLQGLISQMEMDVESRLRKVCDRGKMYEDAAEKSMTTIAYIYHANRQVILSRYVSELKFVEDAEVLARNLTSLRKQSDALSRQLKELRRRVLEQIEELYRTEVDVDIRLRACRGSCHSAVPFSVDHPSYQALQTLMDQLEKTLHQRRKAAAPPKVIPRIKLQPVATGPAPPGEYKTILMVQRELLTQFEDIEQNQVVLEELLEDSADEEVLEPSELE
ncbi:fibrinogen alpha chain-like [Diretmus argenteus]